MDLAGIGAISAAAVALIGVPAAIIVGRWNMRAGIRAAEATAHGAVIQAEAAYRAAVDAVQATAALNHDQWRRSARRDACVQLLLATSKVERLALPEDEAATTPEAVQAAETAVSETLHQAETAYYVVRLESAELADPARDLTDAARRFAVGKRRWAAYLRANSVLDQIEDDTTWAILREVRDAVGLLAEAARDQSADTPDVFGARRDAQQALELVERLTDHHIADILAMQTRPVNVRRLGLHFNAARTAFLEAAQVDLNAPVAELLPGSRSSASQDG